MFWGELFFSTAGHTCEHSSVAVGHVVVEHPLLQTDLARKMDMKSSYQIMVEDYL